MPEPLSTIGIGAIAAYLGKDGLQKLLGPTAEYLGGELQEFTKRRIENVGKIFQNADQKLGDKSNTDGSVPPKVLKEVLNEGSYSEDELAIEYFGGVLASSRTNVGRDDRGARIAKLVARLSTYQLRSHLLIYSTIRHLFKEDGLPFNMEGRPKMQLFIPVPSFISTMDFNDNELEQLPQLMNHTFFGLSSENLIEEQWQYGSKESIKKIYKDAEVSGIICGPSALGCELFLYAFGKSEKPLDYIFADEFDPIIKDFPKSFPNTIGTKKDET